MTIEPPIPKIQFDLENSKSKVKVKGQGQRYPNQRSIQLTFHFCFTSIGPTIPKIWQIECTTGENGFKILRKKSQKNSGILRLLVWSFGICQIEKYDLLSEYFKGIHLRPRTGEFYIIRPIVPNSTPTKLLKTFGTHVVVNLWSMRQPNLN